MPEAAAETDAQHTRKPLSELTKKKYTQAIKRVTDAVIDIENPDEVLEWMKTANADGQPLGESAQKVYLSALKYHFSMINKPFPKKYQEAIDKFLIRMVAKEEEQMLSPSQVTNFVPYEQLLKVQQDLGAIPDKTEYQWKKYLIASLYTLNAPIRADYGDMRVVRRSDPRSLSNQLVWTLKPYFLLREYKTKEAYGTVRIDVSPELKTVIQGWFEHLGKRPRFLLGSKISPNVLLTEIVDAFKKTGKNIGINLLRHAYIKHHFPALKTIKQKEELARRMLHSRDRQEQYNSQNV